MGFDVINRLKKEQGLTNAMIAERAGITLSTLDKITSGKNTNPKLDTLQAICRVLGCRLDDFDDNPKKKSLPPEDEKLLGLSHQLNAEGQGKLIGYAGDLVATGKYKKASPEELAG